MRYAMFLALAGCFDMIDTTEQCHRAVSQQGIAYHVCYVDNGDAFIRTKDFGDVTCQRFGKYTDCDRTAEVYLGEVTNCIQDVQDAMYALGDSP